MKLLQRRFNEPPVHLCPICAFRLPHTDKRVKAYHDEKEQENQKALARWKERTSR